MKHTAFIVLVILLAAGCGRQRKAATIHILRSDGIYNGKKIEVFAEDYFRTEDGERYKILPNGTVRNVNLFKEIILIIPANGDPNIPIMAF